MHDGLDVECGAVVQEIRECVANGQIDGFDVNVMLQRDDSVVCELGGRVEDGLERLLVGLGEDATDCDGEMDLPVSGIPFNVGGTVFSLFGSPDDGDHTHGETDGADTIVDITEWWTHSGRADTGDVLDDLPGPSEFGDDLLVGHLSETQEVGSTMTPSVHAQFVTGHVLVADHFWAVEDTASYEVKGSVERLAFEIGEEFGSVQSWSVIVSVTVLHRVLASGNVDITGALAACPPAPSVWTSLGQCIAVGGVLAISTVSGGGIVWNSAPIDSRHPSLNFWAVRWRDFVWCWVICDINGG